MLFRLRKYISVFALAVFLFPIITEDVHSFSHRNDEHCTEKTSKHFHTAEHHCPICDFVPAVSDKASQYHAIVADVVFTTATFSFEQNFTVVRHNYNFSLRAPPAVS